MWKMWSKESQIWYKFGCMKRILFFMLIYGNKFVACEKTEDLELEGKIVGGDPVDIERVPSSVILTNWGAMCGGTILTNHAVLTAAHCFMNNDDPEEMVIQVGSRHRYDHKAKMHRVAYITIHEEFNKSMLFSSDIAMVFLKRPIRFGPKAKKAVIVDNNQWMNKNERNFTVTGWGMITFNGELADSLLMARLRYITQKECGRLHQINLTEDMFCLYGDAKKDSCKGDSGGGVLWKGLLVGIVSHGDGCAQRNKPSVYSNVWYFRDWIKTRLTYFYDKYYCAHILPRLKRKNTVPNLI